MMKFKINKKAFHQAIQSIIGVVPVKTTIPILGNILLELQDDTLTLTGTDLEVSISTKLNVQKERDGAVAIPAKILFEIVRELPDIPLELDCDEQYRITLQTEKGFYKLSGESRDEFPRISMKDSQGSFEVESERMARMVDKTLFAVSTDELRTTLMGVYLKVTDNELRMVATDGHRLVKFQDKGFSAPELDNETIIPTKALNLLLKNIGSSESIKVNLSSDHIIFELDGTTIYSKGIDGTFPSYERVIPVDNDKKLIVNRDLLSASVKRVSIFSNSITHQIRLSLTHGQVKIQSEDIEFGGEAQENIEVEYDDENLDVGYNANYLLDILRHLDTEEVEIRVKDATSAGILFPASQEENEEVLMLLMPIRLNED
jgi:DNA polymerase-3 subunit beta